MLALDPKTGDYRPVEKVAPPEIAQKMSALHRIGRYREAMAVMAEASGREAELMRKVVLGYVSYGLSARWSSRWPTSIASWASASTGPRRGSWSTPSAPSAP